MYNELLLTNFSQLALCNKYTGSTELSLFFGAISYQMGKTKIKKDGQRVIARSRSQLAEYASCCVNTVDSMMERLSDMKLVTKMVGLWYNKKKMFIGCNESIQMRVNNKRLKDLTKRTGDVKSTVLLSYIAYVINKEEPTIFGPTCAIIGRQEVADLLCVTTKTADLIVKNLVDKRIIEQKGCYWGGKRKYACKITEQFYNDYCTHLELIQAKQELVKKETDKEDIGVSYNNRDIVRDKDKDNNTYISIDSTESEHTGSDVIMNQEIYKMNSLERSYAKAALEKTVLKAEEKLVVTNLQDLWHQIVFSLEEEQHRKNTHSFKHAVNRAMLLLRSGKWRKPWGYDKYSEKGKAENDRLRAMEKLNEELKAAPRPTVEPTPPSAPWFEPAIDPRRNLTPQKAYSFTGGIMSRFTCEE